MNLRTVMPITMASNFTRGFTAVAQQTPAPLTLGNIRANGVGSLIVVCSNATCRHEAIVNVDSQRVDAFVPALGRLCGDAKASALRSTAAAPTQQCAAWRVRRSAGSARHAQPRGWPPRGCVAFVPNYATATDQRSERRQTRMPRRQQATSPSPRV